MHLSCLSFEATTSRNRHIYGSNPSPASQSHCLYLARFPDAKLANRCILMIDFLWIDPCSRQRPKHGPPSKPSSANPTATLAPWWTVPTAAQRPNQAPRDSKKNPEEHTRSQGSVFGDVHKSKSRCPKWEAGIAHSSLPPNLLPRPSTNRPEQPAKTDTPKTAPKIDPKMDPKKYVAKIKQKFVDPFLDQFLE